MTRILAAVAACLLFIAPAFAQNCATWEAGTALVAEYSEQHGIKTSGVLLTVEESRAFWAAFTNTDDPPMMEGERTGILIADAYPNIAMLFGYGDDGCLFQSGEFPFGPVIDALDAAGVKSEFRLLGGEGA